MHLSAEPSLIATCMHHSCTYRACYGSLCICLFNIKYKLHAYPAPEHVYGGSHLAMSLAIQTESFCDYLNRIIHLRATACLYYH